MPEEPRLLRSMKGALATLLRATGAPVLVRNTYARRKVGILLYHDPAPEVLDAHLSYLSPRYSFITLAQLVDALRDRRWGALPPKAMVLTFDDGRSGNAALLPLFRRHRVVPTIYVCTQIVATHRRYWSEDRPDREALKRLPHDERMARLEESGFSVTREFKDASPIALTGDDIDRMRGYVDFQSHTRFHPVLTTCSDEHCREEIELSKPEVEALSGRPCDHISYPNGDYAERERQLARESGYRSARTIDIGWNDASTDPYALRILGVSDDASVTRLAADLAGFGYLRRMRRGSLRGRHRGIGLEGRP